MYRSWIVVVVVFLLTACTAPESKEKSDQTELQALEHSTDFVRDPHSFSNPSVAVTRHLNLELDVNFDDQVIHGVARYQISKKGNADQIIFDIDSLNIEKVTLGHNEANTIHSISAGGPFGQQLAVNIHRNTTSVNIYYSTSPNASAVQWLRAEQTLGKHYPFLFTQGQAILTRSWIPCQDSPGVRLTYEATVKVPEGMLAVMSAENPRSVSDEGVYQFKMDQPIPPYLIALAVGNLEFEAVSENMGVYAEPRIIADAAYEFADMPRMLSTTEELYGPYLWERYDVVVLPPSFPYGGMENPRLTFATPTIIAGDRSLTALVAHELAHSWSGNLVTNATWNDFWLNEGFTVYIEKRIMEALYGIEYSEMLNLLDYQSLMRTVDELGEDNKLTRLKLDLEGKDPDDGMTDIAYEKGFHFLRVIEEGVGREKFDAFLKGYFNHFAFQSVTTEGFLEYLNNNLLSQEDVAVDIEKWVYGTGIPEDIIIPESDRFKLVEEKIQDWYNHQITLNEMDSEMWTTHEWLHFIRALPAELEVDRMEEIDNTFKLTYSKNAEILAAWFEVSINRDYTAVKDELENFLREVGRRKFLMPLYSALNETAEGKEMALRIYARARPNYHAVSVRSIDDLLGFDLEKYKGSISL